MDKAILKIQMTKVHLSCAWKTVGHKGDPKEFTFNIKVRMSLTLMKRTPDPSTEWWL